LLGDVWPATGRHRKTGGDGIGAAGHARRVYTQSHVDYTAEVLAHVNKLRHRIRGLRIVESPPVLRHFTARLEPAHGSLLASS
jgi:hypothetical protein